MASNIVTFVSMGFFGVVSGMKVGSSLRGGGVEVWVEGRFVAEEPEPTNRTKYVS